MKSCSSAVELRAFSDKEVKPGERLQYAKRVESLSLRGSGRPGLLAEVRTLHRLSLHEGACVFS